MNTYIVFNLVLAAIMIPAASCFVGRQDHWKKLGISARVACLMALTVYPWDFFAIHLNAWSYPNDPGLRLYDVPINDLVFTWLCTYLAASVLLAANRWQARSR